MINSRDSYTEYNPNSKNFVEIPYGIGEVLELKSDPDVLARICQYRITVQDYTQVINVGLTRDINDKERKVEFEITADELANNWKKTERMIVGKLDSNEFVHIPGFSEHFNQMKLGLKQHGKNS